MTTSHPVVPESARDATRTLAKFAASLTYERLPAEVVAKARICLLDTLGCCLFGATLPAVRKLAAMAAEEGPGGKATVMGFPLRTSASMAALVNATGAHGFQLDEIHIQATLHPGSVAVPAAWALAETDVDVNGRALITALVAGYETGLRVGLAAKGAIFTRGYHSQGATGALVAGASAGRLLGLDALQMQHAIGIAGSQAAGLMAVQEGAMAKGFHSGRAAQSGVYGAKLAKLGFTGIPNVLEAPYGGFLSTIADGEYDAVALTAELGERWEILNVGFKPAPASNGSITAMTALDQLMHEHNLKAADIERVTAFVSTNTLHHCGWEYTRDKVQGVLAAQMNLRYGLAIMALEREATARQFAEDRLFRGETMDFVSRVQVEHEPKYDGSGGIYRVACRLRVRLRSGAEHETEVLYRPGSKETPMSGEDLHRKFLGLATPVVGAQAAQALVERLSTLERLESIRPLSGLLTPQ
ncbi:MAG: MmgE/PrpD family protein [Burkholderiales bacterium]